MILALLIFSRYHNLKYPKRLFHILITCVTSKKKKPFQWTFKNESSHKNLAFFCPVLRYFEDKQTVITAFHFLTERKYLIIINNNWKFDGILVLIGWFMTVWGTPKDDYRHPCKFPLLMVWKTLNCDLKSISFYILDFKNHTKFNLDQ